MDVVLLPGVSGVPRLSLRRVLGGVLRRGLPGLARRLVGDRPARCPADVPELGPTATAADLLRDPLRVPMSETSTSTRPHLWAATRRSLQSEPRELPPVWLYDERGSQLYEQITRLPDYYLPRREAEILGSHAAEIARQTAARTLVELGSGNARNTRILLDALSAHGTLERFAPVDVSEEMLRATAQAISATYPGISVDETVGDFERDLSALPKDGPRLIALLGSTLGNLHPEQRAALLLAVGEELAEDDVLLLGLDLVKDVARLNAAYHDADGVTEAFVRNALTAVNRELDATFEQRRFVFEPKLGPRERMDGHRLPRARGAHGLGAASRARARVRERRAPPGGGQLEVPTAEVRARARTCRPSHRVVVDRCGGRFRSRRRAAGKLAHATRGDACPRTASAATSTRSR